MIRKQKIILRRNSNSFYKKSLLLIKIEPARWQKKIRLSIYVQNTMKVKELGLKSVNELPSEVRKIPHKNKVSSKIPIDKMNQQIILSLGFIYKASKKKKKRELRKQERWFIKKNRGITDGLNCKKRRYNIVVIKRNDEETRSNT